MEADSRQPTADSLAGSGDGGGEDRGKAARVPLVAPKPSAVTMARRSTHLFLEGLKGLAISPGQTLACVVSLAVAACLVTLFASFGSLAVGALERAGQRARVIVYLKDDVSSGDVEALLGRVRQHSGVERVDYLSREQDRARNAGLLPADVVERLPAEAIPGQHCLEVSFRATPGRAPDIEGLAAFVRSLEGVDVVAEPPVGASRIRSAAAAVEFARVVLTIIAMLLLASTVFFVVGTLHRSMERRREEMTLLRLVGATDLFVRAPLYVQGVAQGLLGVVSGALVALVVIRATNAYLAAELAVGVRIPSFPATTLSLALLVGAGVGTIGALIASARRLP
jgi:cell division transport system permease protein